MEYIYLTQDAIDASNITALNLYSFGYAVKCCFLLTNLVKYKKIDLVKLICKVIKKLKFIRVVKT